MKRYLLFVLAVALPLMLCAQNGLPPWRPAINVTYRLLNTTTTPESMSNETVGVLVFLQTNDPAVAKIDVQISYQDYAGQPHEAVQTVNRPRLESGVYTTLPVPVVFAAPVASLSAITTVGFVGSLVPQNTQ